ncbi:MAG TPA: ribonuclease D [Chroococcales cyanobacterium]
MATEVVLKNKKPELFEGDLPEERLNHYLKKPVIAIDTETRGLIVHRDRLCLVQISDEEGLVSLVRFKDKAELPKDNTNLKKLLEAPQVVKLFHFGRFDIAVMRYYLKAKTNPVWCTKIASKLVRTYTDRHSLKDLLRELLNYEADKTDQTSDWAREDLSESQLEYAANDVRYLHRLQDKLKALLVREGRLDLAERLFQALPSVCELDLLGFQNIFDH